MIKVCELQEEIQDLEDLSERQHNFTLAIEDSQESVEHIILKLSEVLHEMVNEGKALSRCSLVWRVIWSHSSSADCTVIYQ